MLIRGVVAITVLSLTGCASLAMTRKTQNHDEKRLQAKIRTNQIHIKRKGLSDVTQIGRYVTVDNGPTKSQINPLLAISIYRFSPSIYTVGQAVKQVLSTTGYRLVTKPSKILSETLSKPLPITDRKLGPMKIQSALNVLVGSEVYDLVRDPLHRLVDFKIKPSIAKALGEKA